MKKINLFVQYVFLIFAIFIASIHFKNLLDLKHERGSRDYDGRLAQSYSEDQIRQIISGKSNLDVKNLEILIKNYTAPYYPSKTAESQPINENKECKQALSLLKSERDDRIKAENVSSKRVFITFISTIVVAFFIFFLKTQRLGERLVPGEDNRKDLVSLFECIFAIWLIAIGIFLR